MRNILKINAGIACLDRANEVEPRPNEENEGHENAKPRRGEMCITDGEAQRNRRYNIACLDRTENEGHENAKPRRGEMCITDGEAQRNRRYNRGSGCLFRSFALSFLFVFIFNFSFAQSIDDLGVVWSKTYEQGNILNIKPNAGGTYTACGYPWKDGVSTKLERLEGLVIEFDESGNEIRRATARIPQSYIDSHTGDSIADDAFARFDVAFKTDDGGFLAFGRFTNRGAPITEKQYSWSTNDYANSADLLIGLWIVKFDANLNVVKDTLVRGRYALDGCMTENNTFLIAGFDANATEDQSGSTTINISLLREYDQNGNLLDDRRSNYREIRSIYKYPTSNDFIAVTADRFLRINQNLTITAKSFASLGLPGIGANPNATSLSPTENGGIFISTWLHAVTNQTYLNGFGIYKIDGSDVLQYYKTCIPTDTVLQAPLLLRGNNVPAKYIGTAALYNSSGIATESNRIYELTDNGTSFTYRLGSPYPNGTALKTVSQVDGFFSCGMDANGNAAIAKLSTCAKFIVDIGVTNETYQIQTGTVSFAGRNINYSGNTGTVTYNWELTDITQGGAATDVAGTITGTPNTPIPPRTFTLQQDKNMAVLRYTISAEDVFSGGSCQQTQTILIKIYREFPDNINEAECFIEPPSIEWSIRLYKEYDTVGVIQSPLVGDLDGDGYPDILLKTIIPGTNTTQIYYDFIILRGPDFDTPIKHSTNKLISSAEAIARIKWDQTRDTAIIVLMERDNNLLVAYNIHGDILWTSSTPIFNPTYSNIANGRGVGFADFNNDGYAEVYVGNQIFDAKTGIELCNGGTNNKGLTIYSNIANGIFSIAMNVIGDQKLELCAGNQVYEVIINDRTDPAQNSMTVVKEVTPQYNATNLHNDGATVVADFDGDEELEILVQTQEYEQTTGTVGYLYIWKPSTEQILAVHQLTDATTRNVPFVGDINGDGKVEIVVLTANGGTRLMRAFVLNGGVLNQLWRLNHTDNSGSTGLTLFDFNQDGIAEIVYRDETDLRIINGSLKSHLTGADTNIVYNLYSTPAYSGTIYEYPVVADVDGDGHAEILTTSATDAANRANNHNAILRIYKGHVDHPWAPARKVWNQYMYNVLNINEDLTVPRYQFNPATFFPGEDGILDGDDIQPYNSFLQQQTVLSKNGTSFWLSANAEGSGTPEYKYYAGGDSLVITVQVKNLGEAGLQPPFYISAFTDTAIAANIIATDSSMTPINYEETKPVSITIRNLSTYTFDKIAISLNNKDGKSYVQSECDTTNNSIIILSESILMAHNDYSDTIKTSCDNMPITINILANDSIPDDCTPKVEIVSHPAHVTVNLTPNNMLEYMSTLSGIDTVVYRIVCGTDTSEANVRVTIDASGSAFVDDVWYFGENLAGPGNKSAGIRFVKDANGNYIAQDASGESNVYSSENALVISSPYCDGQNIFYSSHSQLYNSLHDSMLNGTFQGNSSVADGLAACYMGNNKYLFFTITNAYNGSKALNAYVVDMNADNGRGAITNTIVVENSTTAMSESLELIAKAGTTHEYWLVYAFCNTGSCNGINSNVLRVRSVDVSDSDNPVIGIVHQDAQKTATSYSYTMKVSPQQNRIAVTHNTGYFDVFDFNNATGYLSNWHSVVANNNTIVTLGLEFSPDGKQLYLGCWTSPSKLLQYDISGATPVYVDSILYGTTQGGGLKLGPDGKIYVMRHTSNAIGVISNPDDSTTSLSSRYSLFQLGVNKGGLQFSTGITKPSVMSCNLNNAPVSQSDDTSYCVSSSARTVTINVLSNDNDLENDAIYLTGANFDNASDADLAELTYGVDSSISLTIKSDVTLSATHVFEITYNLKDDGLPASQCATGKLSITARPAPVISSLLTEICPELTTHIFPNAGGHWTSSDSSTVNILNSGSIIGKKDGTATLVFYDSVTACSSPMDITVNAYPIVPDEITGKKVVCIGKAIELSHSTKGGTWTHNNTNISLDDPSVNPVTVRGLTEGKSFVTYTVYNGICQTKRTFRVKVIPNTAPKIMIGVER